MSGDLKWDLGVKIVRIKTDSSAAKGILQRSGSGKIQHLEVRQLWAQDLVQKENYQSGQG